MTKNILLKFFYFLFFIQAILVGNIYEGFDFVSDEGAKLGDKNAISGQSSDGWISSWNIGSGSAVVSPESISFEGLNCNDGSVILKGDRKNDSFFAKGFIYRQVEDAYEDEIFGSFRIVPGFMTDDTVLGMVFYYGKDLSSDRVTPRNGIFALLPKRWGSRLGMVGAKGKTYKVTDGSPCLNGKEYLVIWKMSGLPKMGESSDVSFSFWVLDENQVEYFLSKGFEERFFNLAEPGKLKMNVSQFGRKDLKDTKRSFFRGMFMVPYIYNTTNVRFDEIRVSSKSMQDAVGIIE
jgi:hypothetical protein